MAEVFEPIEYAGPLTKEQVELYQRQGYLAINGVLSEAEVAELQSVTDDFIDRSRLVSENDAVFDLEPGHTAEAPRLRRLKQPHRQHEVYRRMLEHERILDLVAQLIGDSIYYKSSKLNMKYAQFGSPVEWHQDWAFFPHTNEDLLAVGIPMDGMTVQNGCLSVVPGSHRGPILDHHQDGFFIGAVSPEGVEEHAVPIELRPGGISLHHVRTLHGSAPNTSPIPRRLLLFELVAADAWPLTENTKWADLAARSLRGEIAVEPRMEHLPVRLPYPRDPTAQGSIYEVQKDVRQRGFQRTAP